MDFHISISQVNLPGLLTDVHIVHLYIEMLYILKCVYIIG